MNDTPHITRGLSVRGERGLGYIIGPLPGGMAGASFRDGVYKLRAARLRPNPAAADPEHRIMDAVLACKVFDVRRGNGETLSAADKVCLRQAEQVLDGAEPDFIMSPEALP